MMFNKQASPLICLMFAVIDAQDRGVQVSLVLDNLGVTVLHFVPLNGQEGTTPERYRVFSDDPDFAGSLAELIKKVEQL